MTLRMEQVVPELRAVVRGFVQQSEQMQAGLDRAHSALQTWEQQGANADAEIARRMAGDPRPFALSSGEGVMPAWPAPAMRPLTVVAADGSSIAPDRFAPVPCYAINTGFVSLPYGVTGQAILGSEASVGPRALLVASEDDGTEAVEARGFGVDLLRDVLELERGQDLAANALPDGEVTLILDGTLLPWDLDARHIAESVRADALSRTEGAFARVRSLGAAVSMGAYVSASRASEVMTSLGALAGGPPMRVRSDAALFRRILGEGERSALFRSQSRRSERVETLLSEHAAAFFYLRIGEDVARVELPQWATSREQVERLHATLVDQCRRCDGYPRALQEAHEQAVITGSDRAAFARLLDRESFAQGLAPAMGGKAASKRKRAV